MILELLLITTIICFIIDISGIIESMEWWLSKWLKVNCKIPKPFSCSLCMSFWIGIIWISIFEFTLLNLLFVCLFAALSENISKMLVIIKGFISEVQDAMQLLIKKINN
jgi:hypothetical protein